MKYYEAIGTAIMQIEESVQQPVRLECDIRKKSVKVFVMVEGEWRLMEEILDFNDVTHLQIKTFILGAIEDAC
jgi:hypothetical protein